MQSVSIVHVAEFKLSEALNAFSIAFIREHVLQSQRMEDGEVKGDLVVIILVDSIYRRCQGYTVGCFVIIVFVVYISSNVVHIRMYAYKTL